MTREIIKLTELEKEEIDFTSEEGWELNNGEMFDYVTTLENNKCDGQGHDVIVKRTSDGKFFKYFWMLTFRQEYYFGDEMKEVFPKTKTIYE
jgi:hypothetical protein